MLKETTASEIALRFVMGGAVTALNGWLGQRFGPVVGGIFLAFPTILPAGITLAEQHEGRARASEEAKGAVAGSLGLLVFALAVRLAPPSWSPALVLPLASVGWLAASVVLWRALLA